jgi:hypothetical protein
MNLYKKDMKKPKIVVPYSSPYLQVPIQGSFTLTHEKQSYGEEKEVSQAPRAHARGS